MEVRVYPGLGDNMYAMPVLAKMPGDLYVKTPWPEMFWHLPRVHPMRSGTRLRTQRINESAVNGLVWSKPDDPGPSLDFGYLRAVKEGGNMLQILMDRGGVPSVDFTFPLRPEWIEYAERIIGGRKVCIVQPPTLRKEALSPAKNPDPALFVQVVNWAREAGYTTLALTHLAEGQEWLDCPVCWDEEIQAHWTIVAALAHLSGRVITRLGFMTPVGSAVGARVLTVYGGYVRPEIVEHSVMPGLYTAAPDPFCGCMDKTHECNKEIPTLREDFERWNTGS